MRLVVGLLALTLSGSLALANEATDAKAPPAQDAQPVAKPEARAKIGLRVVRILAESNQALLFDKNRGTHVLAEVGSAVGGFRVEAIDEDEVTLVGNGKELVLAAPAGREHRRSLREERALKPAATTTDAGPADPYDAPDAAGAGPADPYAEPAPRDENLIGDGPPLDSGHAVRSSALPIVDAGAPPTHAPRSAPAALDPDFEPNDAPAPAVVTPTVLSRRELTASLADFAKLTSVLRGGFTAEGARLDVVAEGSVFAKAGLRSGDIVTAIDQTQLRSLDDAADLYVRASATKAANVHVLRAGKPLVLRVLIH